MTTDEYIGILANNDKKRLHVINVQCVAHMLYEKGYPKYTIANSLKVSNSHVNYMINTFDTLISTGDTLAWNTRKEAKCHEVGIHPYFSENGNVQEIVFSLIVDNKKVML